MRSEHNINNSNSKKVNIPVIVRINIIHKGKIALVNITKDKNIDTI